MKLALHGATGRMGRAIARLATEAGDIQIVGAICHAEDPALGQDIGELAGVGNLGVEVGADLAAGLLGADVVIDFSLAPAVQGFLKGARAAGVPVVMGTTGLGDAERDALKAASQDIAVLWAQNMSLGIQVLAELVTQALNKLGPAYDAEIIEIHHRKKVDCPSGTAKRLMDAVADANPERGPLYERSGQVGPRTDTEVGVFGLRGGDVIGDHTVYLMGPGERIELTHRATSRDLFAHGAIRAARWLAGRSPGYYSIPDVLAG
jgi:4-hydroxy-tetrahydrodipicolinate reductase